MICLDDLSDEEYERVVYARFERRTRERRIACEAGADPCGERGCPRCTHWFDTGADQVQGNDDAGEELTP